MGTPAPAPARPAFLRLRSSVLGKVLGALVVTLIVSTSVTALVDARLTHDAVATQTAQVATSNLRVLQEAFTERQRTLVVSLRTVGDRLVADGLTDPARRPDLFARLGVEATNLQLDQLDVLTANGTALSPPVSVGKVAPLLPLGRTGQPFTSEPTSRLLRTNDGSYVQSVPVPLGSGAQPLVLLGGLQFGDELAFQLRRQIGELANVILVAGGRLAGSTLADPTTASGAAPAYDKGSGGRPPSRPQSARLNGVASVVAYVSVGLSAGDPLGGALGIALKDPAAPLDRALGLRRLLTGALLAVLALILGWVLFRALTQPLVNLAATAQRIAGGDLDRRFVAQGSDEIAQLAGALEHMREELQAKLALVARQTAELQEGSQRIVAAQDEERRRLARDLHDGIQQELVVLRMRLGLASDAADPHRLEAIGAELDQTIVRLREVSHDLYPAILRDRGLAAAVRSYASRLPVESRLTMTPDPLPRVSMDVESGAYFLLCESVTNALKHAGASELSIDLSVSDAGLRVKLRDDGRGFALDGLARRGGLLHMEDRVRSFGGQLSIESTPGAGTTVVATFPIPVEPTTVAIDVADGPDKSGKPDGSEPVTSSAAGERTAPPPPDDSYLVPR